MKTIYTNHHKYLVQGLKKARNLAGLSQKKVAKFLEIDQAHYSKIELGQLRIDMGLLKKFSKLYPHLIFVIAKDTFRILESPEQLSRYVKRLQTK